LAHALENELDFLAAENSEQQQRDVDKCLRLLDQIKTTLAIVGGRETGIEPPARQNTTVPISTKVAATEAPIAAGKSEGPLHTDHSFYFRAAMRASRRVFNENDSILAAAMTRLAGPQSLFPRGVAGELLHTMRVHPAFAELDRVCLVQRIGLSNQLRVVSSANSFGENLMADGYRCTISANGSLFRLSSQSMRFFGSAQQIVKSFGDAPPQRSIYRIAKSGLVSGFALGIYQQELPRGFLFFNSRSPAFLETIEESLHLVSHPALIARAVILADSIDPVYERLWQTDPTLFNVAFADQVGLETCWQALASAMGVNPACAKFAVTSSLRGSWLLSPGDLCFVLLKAIQSFAAVSASVEIFADAATVAIKVRFDRGVRMLAPLVSGVRSVSRLLGFEFATIQDGLHLQMPADWCANQQRLPYSVESDG
jgi:hypothetical protein